MLELLQTILAFILVISILVTIHEYGHYYVARLCGVHVLRFSIGFGWPLWKRRGKAPAPGLFPTEFVIAGSPLGGYVKMLDEREGPVAARHQHLAFNTKTPWQRIAIAAAGPGANFLLAILIYWLAFTVGVTGLAPVVGQVQQGSPAAVAGIAAGQRIVAVDGEPTASLVDVNMALAERLGDTGTITLQTMQEDQTEPSSHAIPVERWLSTEEAPAPLAHLGIYRQAPVIPAIVGKLVSGGAAEAAGLLPDDEILAVNGEPVADWYTLIQRVHASPERPMALEAQRGGAVMEFVMTPAATQSGDRTIGFAGFAPKETAWPEELLVKRRYPLYSAWIPAVEKTWDITIFTFEAIGKMVVGAIAPSNLSGPITIAKYASLTVQDGLETFLNFLAVISISLAVINLLPIPVLDGGHLLYYFIELLRGRPLPEKVQMVGLQIGLLMVLGIMSLAIYFDITRI